MYPVFILFYGFLLYLPMNLTALLWHYRAMFHPLFAPDLSTDNTLIMDFSHTNPEWKNIDVKNVRDFDQYVFQIIKDKNCRYGYGGYLEDREIYRRSALFSGSDDEPRSIHLGIDVWTEAGTKVYAPMDSKLHSFRDNDNYGDYGPTIILEHNLAETTFFTLYGHLSRASLLELEEGEVVKGGTPFCEIGPFPENGDYPPHLHFQVIEHLDGKKGDYFGVCKPSEKEHFALACPDPGVFFSHLFS